MAERRMFARSVVFYDALPELTHSAQVLYFHLNMHADDDGLVGNPKPVMRLAQCTPQDLQELRDCELVLTLEGGAVAITHWRVHNQIRRDRYKPTRLREAFAQLVLTDSGAYRLRTPQDGCPFGNQTETQDRIDKDRQGKVRLGKYRTGEDKASQPQAAGEAASSSYIEFVETVFSIYKQYCGELLPCNGLTKKLRDKILQLEDDGWTLDAITNAFQKACQSEFLKGGGEDGWVAGLEWLCTDDNLRKVAEGRYQPWKRTKKSAVPMGGSALGEAELEAIQKLLGDDAAGMPS